METGKVQGVKAEGVGVVKAKAEEVRVEGVEMDGVGGVKVEGVEAEGAR